MLRCDVNMGCMKTVCKGWYTSEQLLQDGVDSLRESGRDCYMLPSNGDLQINMNSIKMESSLIDHGGWC